MKSFILQSVNNRQTTTAIDCTNPTFTAYAEELHGTNFTFADVSNNTKRERRGHLITTAKTFALNTGTRYQLKKEGKNVPRPSQYLLILEELHDEGGHVGTTKLTKIIS